MGDTPSSAIVITDRLLRSWIRCRRKAWLDKYGDNIDRAWTAHRNLFLASQYQSFQNLLGCKPGKGLKACIQGNTGVVGVRLKGQDSLGHLLEAHPPLLYKIKGKSIWGNYAYLPVVGRQGRKVNRDNKLALSLSGLLLENVQNSSVKEGLSLTTSANNNTLDIEHVFLTKSLKKQLHESLVKLKNDLLKKDPPPITKDRRKCKLCSWRKVCDVEASKKSFLNEVSGIGASRCEMLNDLGIFSLKDLADANPIILSKKLERFGLQHSQKASEFISQAKTQKTGNPERLDGEKVFPEFKKAPGVLIYDIESDPDIKEDFLHGFLQINRQGAQGWCLTEARYHPLLMIGKDREGVRWERLKKKIYKYSSWPILHYGETEALSILRMAKRQKVSISEIDFLRRNLIDVQTRLRLNWRLPLRNYGLKEVAKWLGFEWSQKGASGALALLWWRQWKASDQQRGKTEKLYKIFNYNREDCLATWAITEWILQNEAKSN